MRKTINSTPGLWLSQNTDAAPLGALKQALGVIIKRPGVIEKLRPHRQYSASQGSPTLTGTMQSLFYYNGVWWQANTAGILWMELSAAPGVFVLNGATLRALPPSHGNALRTAEQNGNLYLATIDGVQKTDTITTAAFLAGVPRALDTQLTLQAGTLLANTNSVAYRAVFGILDANTNLILGPPGGRVTVTATGAQDVSVKVWMPSAISGAANATSYFVQVYRTAVGTVAAVDPGEEMQLVYQATLTATDAGNKFVTFVDATPDGLRGAQLYSAPSQDGLAAANYAPPICADMALFKGSMFYANTVSKYRARVQLLGVSKNLLTITVAAGGITKSGGNGVYTFTGSPDLSNIPTDGTAKLSSTGNTSAANNGEFVITAVNTGAFTITVTNAAAVTEAGAASSRAWPSKISIAGVNYYGSINGTETPGSQIFKVSTAGTASQNVVDTAASLLRVVNQQAVPVVYGYYESGPDDGAGRMLFEEAAIGGSGFSLSAAGTLLFSSFNPTIPSTATQKATNDTAQHRLMYSKPGQPEHVPLGNYFDIGGKTQSILRIIALRDALLVFKQDGLYRVTGDGAGNFAVALFDSSVRPYSSNIKAGAPIVVSMFNKAYIHALTGALSISESSVTRVDGPLDNIFRLYGELTPQGGTRVLACDADASLFFYVPAGAFLTTDRCFVYCLRTNAWTEANNTNAVTDGVNTTAFYALNGEPLNGFIYRQTAAGSIYRQDTAETRVTTATGWPTAAGPTPAHKFLINISSDNGSTTITATAGDLTPAVGSIIENHSTGGLFKVTQIAGSVYTLSPYLGSTTWFWLTGWGSNVASCVYSPNPITVEWQPFAAGDAAEADRITEVAVLLDGTSTTTTATMNAYSEASSSTLIGSISTTNTPFPAGISTQTLFRSLVPSTMQHARKLSVLFQHSTVAEFVFINGISYEFVALDGPAHEVA